MAKLLVAPTKNAVQKTLAAQLLNTAGVGDPITFDDVDGIPNLPGVLVINRVDSSGAATASKREYIEYSGTSGNTVLITTRNVDNSNAALTHAVGSIVEFISDVTWADRIYDALSVVTDVDDVTAVNTTNVVTPTDTQTLTNKSITLTGSNVFSSSGASITAILDEDTLSSDSATALATQQSVKAYVDTQVASVDVSDWKDLGQTLTYASADDPTYTATVSGVDLTSTLSAGMRLRVSQSTGGTKYFIITAVAFSTDTTITLYGGTDYNLENEAISSPVYATVKAPVGFPLNPTKWEVITTNTSNVSESSPTNSTFISTGLTIVKPIGKFRISIQARIEGSKTSTTVADCVATLSSDASTETNSKLTASASVVGPSGTWTYGENIYREEVVSSEAKQTYTLMYKTNNAMASIRIRGDQSDTIIRATSIYL